MSFSHIKMILRILIQNRKSTLINFLGLILGLTSFVIIFSWIRTEYSKDRFHVRGDQLFQLVIQFPEGILDPNTPYALAPEMKEAFPEVENYSRLVRLETQINSSFDFFPDDSDNEPVYETRVAMVDTGFFNMFSFNELHGDINHGIAQTDGVILSSELARKYYGETNPVGLQILMNGSQLLEVAGVVEVPDHSQFNYDLFLPVNQNIHRSWNWRDPSFILLKPAVNLDDFKSKITSFLNATMPNPLPGEFILKAISIKKTNLVFGKRNEFLLFSGIAVLILIIVAFNYMNLSTANYTRRIKEMSLRKINGATPGLLRNQLITETLIQTSLALFIAFFLAELALPRLSDFFQETVLIGYTEHSAVLPGYILLILIFSLLSVAYPVAIFTKGNPTEVLRDSSIKGKSRSNILLITTILQFTISVTLLITSLMVVKQVRFARNLPPGLNVQHVIKVPLNPRIEQKLVAFFDELESNPGILETTAGQKNPVNEDYKTKINWPNRNPSTDPLVRYSICLPDFPAFFGHEIIMGRNFRDQDFSDRSGFLINEAACELLGKENPVGTQLEMWGQQGEILGVFKNYHHISVHSKIMPHVVTSNPMHYRQLRYVFIRLASQDQEQSIAFIKEKFQQFAGDFPFIYTYLSDETEQLYAKEIRLSKILIYFTFLALLISCLGIFGLAQFSVERKVKDLTIRRVFGASMGKIIQLAQQEMLRRIGLAIIIAIPIAYFLLNHWLRTFAYRADLGWLIFFLGGIIGIVITFLTTLMGIRSSLKKKPSEILNQN